MVVTLQNQQEFWRSGSSQRVKIQKEIQPAPDELGGLNSSLKHYKTLGLFIEPERPSKSRAGLLSALPVRRFDGEHRLILHGRPHFANYQSNRDHQAQCDN